MYLYLLFVVQIFICMPTLRGRKVPLRTDHIDSVSRGYKKRQKAKVDGGSQTRAKAARLEEHDNTAASLPALPGTPPLDLTGRKGKPGTKNDPITCLDFGLFRQQIYPGAKFCSHCDDWQRYGNVGLPISG